ncbi:MAG: hypothetical protein GX986_11995 [Firmicutes bacterium]|nr:hypothetical protein [Bacillota bacterium]
MQPNHVCHGYSKEHLEVAKKKDQDCRALFPRNLYVERLLEKAASLNVLFLNSQVEEQWLYHPEHRALCIWLPDLEAGSLSYLVVMLAHELGHVLDFDARPWYLDAIRDVPWFAAPLEIELSAFVSGFAVLQELDIPITLEQYCQMIEEPMAHLVDQVIRQELSLAAAVERFDHWRRIAS